MFQNNLHFRDFSNTHSDLFSPKIGSSLQSTKNCLVEASQLSLTEPSQQRKAKLLSKADRKPRQWYQLPTGPTASNTGTEPRSFYTSPSKQELERG